MDNVFSLPTITHVSLHVQATNETAIDFYKNIGFVEKAHVPNYYTSTRQPHAVMLECDLAQRTL